MDTGKLQIIRSNDKITKEADHVQINTRKNHKGWKAYLRKDAKKIVSQYAAPARQKDYTGLPPVYTFMHAFDMMKPEEELSKEAALKFNEQFEYARQHYFAPQKQK